MVRDDALPSGRLCWLWVLLMPLVAHCRNLLIRHSRHTQLSTFGALQYSLSNNLWFHQPIQRVTFIWYLFGNAWLACILVIQHDVANSGSRKSCYASNMLFSRPSLIGSDYQPTLCFCCVSYRPFAWFCHEFDGRKKKERLVKGRKRWWK